MADTKQTQELKQTICREVRDLQLGVASTVIKREEKKPSEHMK